MSGFGALCPDGAGAGCLEPFDLVNFRQPFVLRSGEEALTPSLVGIPLVKTAIIQRKTPNATLDRSGLCFFELAQRGCWS